MPGSLAEDQGEVESKPTPKKTGSARTSKKGKRKMLVLFDYRGNPGKQNPSSASHSSTQRRRSATKGGESSHPPGEANSQATSQTPDQIFRLEVQNANLVEIPVSSRAGRSTGSHLQRADDFSRLTGATGQQEEETHRAVTRWEGWEYTDLPEFFNALYPYSSVLPEVREPRDANLEALSHELASPKEQKSSDSPQTLAFRGATSKCFTDLARTSLGAQGEEKCPMRDKQPRWPSTPTQMISMATILGLPYNNLPPPGYVLPAGLLGVPSEIFKQAIIEGQKRANDLASENVRPTPPNLRYGGFPGQQAAQGRNLPLASGRLQNTSKIATNGNSWGFAANGALGLSVAQPRQPGAGTTSFAQTIGGSQQSAPLDLSEFPSLSGSSQPQYQNQSQAIWANQRTVQQTPVQRPQQPQNAISSQASQHGQSQQTQDQSQRGNEGMFTGSSHLQGAMDDHRYGNQSGMGSLSTSRQPQTSSADDFPPLGRNGTDEIEVDRRSNLIHNGGFGDFSNSNAFSIPPGQSQARHGLPSGSSSQANNTRSSSVVDRLTSPNGMGFGVSSIGRSPVDPSRQAQNGIQDHDRNNLATIQGNTRNETTMNSLLSNFTESPYPPHAQPSQQIDPLQGRHDYGDREGDSSGANLTHSQTPLSQMSAIDEWGIAGMLAIIRSDDPNVASLARGQDLTTLGLNLNSAEPLYPTFNGPFADEHSRPMHPDIRLPECYTVDNVHRVREKIPGFSDETLFWIFYTQPRDILQELAATELTNRNWRFHKELGMWLTKDVNLPEPIQISADKEQGSYVFFNHNLWEKTRVPHFELHYGQLAPSSARSNGQ